MLWYFQACEGIWKERIITISPFTLSTSEDHPWLAALNCWVQCFYLCGLSLPLSQYYAFVQNELPHLWLFYAKLVCCLWLFPSIPQLDVCFSVSLWCVLCLPCLQATYVVPFYTWRPSKMCERESDQSCCL